MKSRRSLLLSCAAATLVVVPIALAVTPTPAEAATLSFNGTISATGNKWDDCSFKAASPSQITAQLAWSNNSAKLSMYLFNPSGEVRAVRHGSNGSATLSYVGNWAGTWRLGVQANSGSSSYSVSLSYAGTQLTACSGTTPAPQPTSSPSPDTTTTTGTPGRYWAVEQENSTHTYTLSQAITQANTFNVITALPNSYTGKVPAMKQANPSLRIYGYMQGAFAQANQGSYYPASWYLHDAQGNKIKNSWGLWLMNPADSGWVNDRISHCQSLMSQSDYDGCYVDNLGDGTIWPGMISSTPINPATNAPYTNGAWLSATANLAAQMNAAVTGTIVVNGLVCGRNYFDPSAPTRQLLQAADMASAEIFMRTAHQGISQYRGTSVWKQDVDMLVNAGVMGHPLLTVTKVWVSGTTAQINAWQLFALTSFMLGTNGNDYFTFSGGQNLSSVSGQSLWTSFALGTPSGGYTAVGNAYQRQFTNGKVVVNPTANAVTLSLGRSYKTLAGTWASTVTLPAHTGQILTLS